MLFILDWFVFSSENADKWALTIKGLAVSVVPFAIALANLTHLKLQSDQLTAIFAGIESVVSAF